MSKLPIIIFSLSIFLAGCTVNSAALPVIESHKIYKGYPCFEACPAFKEGYEQAKSKKLTRESQCSDFDASSQLGCQAFVTDYQVDTQNNGGLHLE